MKLSIFVSLLLLLSVGISSQTAQGFRLNLPKGFEHISSELTVLAGMSAIDTSLRLGIGVKSRVANWMELGAIASRTAEFMERGVITKKGDSAELQELFLEEWRSLVRAEVTFAMVPEAVEAIISEAVEEIASEDKIIVEAFIEKAKQAQDDSLLLLDGLIRGDTSAEEYQQEKDKIDAGLKSEFEKLKSIINQYKSN